MTGRGPGTGPGAAPGLFTGVDRALVLSCLADRLRRAGVPVALAATGRAAAALATLGRDDGGGEGSGVGLTDLYWATRLSLVSDRSQLATFDAVFDAVFRSGVDLVAPGRRERPDAPAPASGDRLQPLADRADAPPAGSGGLPWATRPRTAATAESDDGTDDAAPLPELVASAAEALADRPFDLLDPVELAAVCRLVERWATTRPTRPGRRHRPAAGGRVELRRTLRRAGRTGGDPVELGRHRPRRRQRRLTLLLDVSGSMETYARVYLHLARSLVSTGGTEVFALSTGAARLTGPLRSRSVDDAVERATLLVEDRFGGTRLATSIGAVIGHRTWSGAVRGGVVVIVSDGWDTDPPELLARRMARLSRLAHRVVWVNPRSAAGDYLPLVGGMAAALPHCDRFLSGHSLAALAEVLDAASAHR